MVEHNVVSRVVTLEPRQRREKGDVSLYIDDTSSSLCDRFRDRELINYMVPTHPRFRILKLNHNNMTRGVYYAIRKRVEAASNNY